MGIELKITGSDINPQKMRAKEYAQVLISLEESVVPMMLENDPNLDPKEISLGFERVKAGSFVLVWQPTSNAAITCTQQLIKSLRNQNYSGLPEDTIKNLRALVSASYKLNRTFVLKTNGTSNHESVEITANTKIESPPDRVIVGKTSVYGKVERIGGKNKPKVAITPIGETKILTCEIDEDMAKELAKYLYSFIGLQGVAKWNLYTEEIEHFSVENIAPYNPEVSIEDSFTVYYQITGKTWENIRSLDDLSKEISNIRGDEEP